MLATRNPGIPGSGHGRHVQLTFPRGDLLQAPPSASRGAPRSARSYASAEEEATSTIIAEYESTHPVPPRPDPRALRRDARRADALRRIRARLVQSVPGRRSRARYMERYFARRCGDDVALYVGGFGEGPPTFIEPRLNGDFHADALAPHVPGTPLAHRLVSLDHLPAGATGPDLRDVALGRHDPTRSETSGRRNAGGLVPGFGDGLTDLGGGGFGDSDGDSDDAFLDGASSASFGDGFDPASFTRRSEPPPRRRWRAGGWTSTARWRGTPRAEASAGGAPTAPRRRRKSRTSPPSRSPSATRRRR